jgi:protocatechuate 3,4-dioxygenase beta subunit
MSRLLHYSLFLAFSLSSFGLHSAANSQTKPAKRPVGSSVSGRITIHGKGAAGIVVGLRSSDSPAQPLAVFRATTDPDGNYRIAGLPAGNYQVAPMAPALVLPELALARAGASSLLLGEGEDVQNVDFALERGGVIAGRVSDADGRPVVEERLMLVLADQNQQRQQMFGPINAAGAQTDDRGVYRIYGLVPGRYKISVGRDDDSYYFGSVFGRPTYERTYFPDTTDPTSAKVIEVTEGSETANVDITIGRPLPTFVASGTVVDAETGQPVPGLRIGLRRTLQNDYVGVNSAAVANRLGDFRLENLTPGKYAVMILPMPGIETRADAVTFEVVDQDVTGLLVKTFKGFTVSGVVVVEGKNENAILAKLAELRLRAFVRGEGPMQNFANVSTINGDGSFRIGGLTAGTANFWLASQDGRPPVNFNIVRVERDGVVQPRGLELNGAESQIAGVKIFLRYGTGSVKGEVRFENGPLPAGARVMVWLKKAGENSSSFRPNTTDSRGRFLIEGVSAGDYELHVQANLPGRPSPPVTATVTVAEGTVSDVVVTLDLKPNPTPRDQ